MQSLKRLLLLCSLLLIAAPTLAATATTPLTVSGTVGASCTIDAVPLNFGVSIPSPVASNIDVNTTVTATCTNGAGYTIGMNAGTGAGATVAVRKMTSGLNTMNYSIYTTAGRTVPWGTTVGTDTVAGTGNGAGQVITVFGRIPPQTTASGSYSDTVTVTLTF